MKKIIVLLVLISSINLAAQSLDSLSYSKADSMAKSFVDYCTKKKIKASASIKLGEYVRQTYNHPEMKVIIKEEENKIKI